MGYIIFVLWMSFPIRLPFNGKELDTLTSSFDFFL